MAAAPILFPSILYAADGSFVNPQTATEPLALLPAYTAAPVAAVPNLNANGPLNAPGTFSAVKHATGTTLKPKKTTPNDRDKEQ